jgi:NAD(P)-dependent dehydrogenase (short-subunit alcohol dehydrogenase family)
MTRYQDKKVVILGGTRGMGLATAKKLLDGRARSRDVPLPGGPWIGAERAWERRSRGFERRAVAE